MRGLLVLLAGLSLTIAMSGCSKDTKIVLTVVLSGEEGEEAVSGVKFSLLPYDIEAVKDSLAGVNNPPSKPSKDELLALRGAYDEINKEYNDHLEEYRTAESDVKKIKDLMSSKYKVAYKRYKEAKAKNKELNEQREKARSEYIASRKAYDSGMEKWEGEAYKGLEDVLQGVRLERGITEDYLIKTDKQGVGRVVVPGGKWWINGKERHRELKYAWLIWNVPVQAEGGVLEITLNKDNAEERME